jgi:hypothetical protein
MEQANIEDLTKQPPRSPHTRLGGYVILARTIDKCRALLKGKIGEYHYDCPVDNMLFSFKGIEGNAFKEFVGRGKSDGEIVDWVNEQANQFTPEDIQKWSDSMEKVNPAKKIPPEGWFLKACAELKLDPNNTTLFQYLDADDKASFTKPGQNEK